MSWQHVLGHDRVAAAFARCVRHGRLASAYLFVGPPGHGKRTFALALARALACTHGDRARLSSCEKCASCRLMQSGDHPDLFTVARPPGKSFIPVELLIGDAEHRMQAGLCHHLALKPYMADRRMAVVDDADALNDEGANCLLKTLEEPPPRSLLILVATSDQRLLPTIRSRCQVVRFRPLAPTDLAELIRRHGWPANRLELVPGQGMEEVGRLLDADAQSLRTQLGQWLAAGGPDVAATATLLAFVDQAGSEPAAKRERAREVIAWASEFLRVAWRNALGLPEASAHHGPRMPGQPAPFRDPQALADCLDYCLRALEHLDRNAHVPGLLEGWAEDLHRRLHHRFLPSPV